MVSGTNAGLFDTDGDGLFEQAEYTAFGDNNFGVWDSDDDGWIDDNEFGVGFDNAGWDNDVGVFDNFDDDDNSFLDSNEFFAGDEFGVWDSDSDGILDDDEWGVSYCLAALTDTFNVLPQPQQHIPSP